MGFPRTIACLDTSVFLLFLGYGMINMDLSRICNAIRAKHFLLIPQIVLGEADAVLIRGGEEGILYGGRYAEAFRWFRKNARFADNPFQPLTNAAIEAALELTKLSDDLGRSGRPVSHSLRIANNDAAIAGQAIANRKCAALYTMDEAMRGDVVKRLAKDYLKSGRRDIGLELPSLLGRF